MRNRWWLKASTFIHKLKHTYKLLSICFVWANMAYFTTRIPFKGNYADTTTKFDLHLHKLRNMGVVMLYNLTLAAQRYVNYMLLAMKPLVFWVINDYYQTFTLRISLLCSYKGECCYCYLGGVLCAMAWVVAMDNWLTKCHDISRELLNYLRNNSSSDISVYIGLSYIRWVHPMVYAYGLRFIVFFVVVMFKRFILSFFITSQPLGQSCQ